MKLKNLKISKQINIWLGSIFLIVTILALTSVFFMNALWENTSNLYRHPLTVRRAVGEIEADVLRIHNNMLQLVLGNDQQRTDEYINEIDAYEVEINRQLDVLYDRFLGPKDDINELVVTLSQWKTIRAETVRLFRMGQITEAQERVNSAGIGGIHAEKIKDELNDISDFAIIKGDEFHQTALEQRNANMMQLSALIFGVFLLLSSISYLLRKGILPPLNELTTTTEAFQQGKHDARIQYDSTDEIGLLSKAFNTMATTIETEIDYRDSVISLSSIMTNQDSLRLFCQELLKGLMLESNSQMGAVYFKNEQNQFFEPYESAGFKHDQLCSFSASAKEGEFGTALVTETVQHLTDIPSDSQIIFSTVSGDYQAKEIMTIPVKNGDEIISIISLASIKSYAPGSVRLIKGIQNEITARLNAILANNKIHEFSQRLQSTNAELQQQAKELEMQTDELTEQNAELEMQKIQLDDASRLKTTFLSSMSHELRTPLNSVIALSGVLSRKLVNQIPKEEYSYLEIIERNGENLLKLINNILDISRIEAGYEEVDINRFNANHAIDEVIAMIQPHAQQQNIKLLHESEDTIIISSDVDMFRHIMQNLISNAVKFTEKGQVTVSSRQNENNIIVKVIDTGIGISKEHLPYIFDEFRQADGSTSRRYGGAGLGLAIAKKYSYLLGGTISVKSTLSIGSEFTLTLPLQYTSENAMKEQEITDGHEVEVKRLLVPGDYEFSEKSILLVEDNESAIIQIGDLVEDMGFQLKIARDAGEAFTIIDQMIPDAMILDLLMPGVDGFRVLETLRNAEQTAHIPVLILTAKHITKDELKFLKRNNIHQLIQKGDVKRVELQKAIKNMLYLEKIKNEELPKKNQTIEGKPVVLVVEDNPDNMITVKALLKDHYTVLEAVNAHECFEMALKCIPNLILMDIALPDISGIEAFQQIRTMTQLQDIPVIAMTASAMTHDREAILSYGFDAYIAKPIIAKEFFKVIQEVLYGK